MKKQSIFLFVFAIFLFGCNHSEQSKHQGVHQAENNQTTVLQLNNGEKWKANTETIEGVKAMQVSVNNLPANPTLGDYRQLKSDLESNFNTIFEKCTMTGAAHEQLHNFLLPLTHMTEFLGSKDIENCKTTVKEIKVHLAVFDTYFE